MGYGELRRYRSRRSLQRLVIPGALAALVVGGAVGAAASFFASHSTTSSPPAHGHAGRSAASPPRSPATGATKTRHAGATTATPSRTSGTVTADSVTVGERLNDQGYALIRQGDYAAALPLLRRAVVDLRGTGPANPYEAYANYNLGYALLSDGSCAAALSPLATAKRLETSPLVGIAIRRAQACSPAGS
jgi:TolA-binding protein